MDWRRFSNVEQQGVAVHAPDNNRRARGAEPRREGVRAVALLADGLTFIGISSVGAPAADLGTYASTDTRNSGPNACYSRTGTSGSGMRSSSSGL
jgi:hypothetical protein